MQSQSIPHSNSLVERFSQIMKVTHAVFVATDHMYWEHWEQPSVLLYCFW